MASKKYTGLFGLLCLFVSGAFAQIGGSYDVLDSSVVPSKRLPQHTEFMANNYPYPAKPRNQWEIGVKGSTLGISGDVRNRWPGWGAGIHVRKALGYVMSLRADFGYGSTRGLNWMPSRGYANNPAWAPYLDASGNPTTPIFYNYRTRIYDASIEAVFALNNIRFHRAKNGFSLYGLIGITGMIYDTKIDALDGNGNPYNFSAILAKYGPTGFRYKDRKDIKKDLKSLLDGKYETPGEFDKGHSKVFGKPFKPALSVGGGFAFKLSKIVSLAVEDRMVITKSDLLDGQQWQENVGPVNGTLYVPPAQTRDYDTYNFLSVGLNFAIGSRRSVEPLWWVNPLDYAYNELNRPRHMKLPKPILDDSDGDGVTDQFDLEPNTPAGAPVDTHGVSRDTDGDGVPDYKDKELITPTQCQPVDADGIGKCPPPACCDSLRRWIEENGVRGGKCRIGDLPSITFKGRSVALSNDAKALLASVAQKIRDNSDCKIAVIGYCSSSKSEQQVSWDRVNAVINYLVEKEGISADRFIFKYGETGGDCNTVDLRDGTGEEGPNSVPAPHPNLRKK